MWRVCEYSCSASVHTRLGKYSWYRTGRYRHRYRYEVQSYGTVVSRRTLGAGVDRREVHAGRLRSWTGMSTRRHARLLTWHVGNRQNSARSRGASPAAAAARAPRRATGTALACRPWTLEVERSGPKQRLSKGAAAPLGTPAWGKPPDPPKSTFNICWITVTGAGARAVRHIQDTSYHATYAGVRAAEPQPAMARDQTNVAFGGQVS